MSEKTVDSNVLRKYVQDLFIAKGVRSEDAYVLADCMVDADLTGVSTHGVYLVSYYLTRIDKGVLNLNTNIEIEQEYPSSVLLNGHDSLGMVTAKFAMEKAIAKARENGSCVVGVNNSNHFGMSAYYVKMAAEQDMVGIAITNAPANIAPWGSNKPYFGTNPLAMAAPTLGDPLVLDMATSVSSMGKINLAAKVGKPIPLDWAIDEQGNPTTDPVAAQKGTVLPVGGPKGYGLTLFIDVLGGFLTGALNGPHIAYVVSKVTEYKPQRLGHLFFVIDISKFVPVKEFKERVEIMKEEVKAYPKNPGVTEIFMPGEIELRQKKNRLKNGIPLAEAVYQQLIELGNDLNVPVTI